MWRQKQISDERYAIIEKRYQKFIDTMNDPCQEPIRVFDPLSQKHLEELELIRKVSRDLQAKKEEDMRKAAQDKEEEKKAAEKEKEKEAEEKSEENGEEKEAVEEESKKEE